ncbi:Uncharacterised protein [Clostridium perfringens]|nr:Uncharacterised protein [Clostridium perfringens]
MQSVKANTKPVAFYINYEECKSVYYNGPSPH